MRKYIGALGVLIVVSQLLGCRTIGVAEMPDSVIVASVSAIRDPEPEATRSRIKLVTERFQFDQDLTPDPARIASAKELLEFLRTLTPSQIEELNETSVEAIAELLLDPQIIFQVMAADCLAVLGARSEPALPLLERARQRYGSQNGIAPSVSFMRRFQQAIDAIEIAMREKGK